MWPRGSGEASEGPDAPEDDPDYDEPVSSHFNTNNFGNFLEALLCCSLRPLPASWKVQVTDSKH